MPRLDPRLKAVAKQIRSPTHADIGSDHGHLLVALLKAGRIARGIAVENKQQPLKNSQTALAGLPAVVRFAHGLAGLQPGEADSLSLCGMGGEAIAGILGAHPLHVPASVVVQPNRRAEAVRVWALRAGFHLVDEQLVSGRRMYPVLRFQRCAGAEDPSYKGFGIEGVDSLDREAALLFGPLMLRRQYPSLLDRLREERLYLRQMQRLGPPSARRLAVIEHVLAPRFIRILRENPQDPSNFTR